MHMGVRMTNLDRERLIQQCFLHMVNAASPSKARYWLGHMSRLVASRPANVVSRMESEKGLR